MSDSLSPEDRPSPWRWWICFMLLLASVINYLDRMTLNQTAIRIQTAFDIKDETYSLLESIFTVGFGLGTFVLGWVVDRYGVRWIYPLAVLGWSASGFLTGYSETVAMLFLCRFSLGVFEAGNWPCGIRTVRQVMPPKERTLGNACFQNGTAIGAVLAPIIILWALMGADHEDLNAWRLPFRIIGLIGLGWVFLWFFTVPSRVLNQDHSGSRGTKENVPFSAVLADRRFWILILVIIAVNTSWHTFRVWSPKFLQQQHGYSESDMSYSMVNYYLIADAGAWMVGLGTYILGRAGWSAHRSRMMWFLICTAIITGSGLMLPMLERGQGLSIAFYAFGFGAFGLFPVYFALSQELSGKHQGKVTGTLGLINALYLTGMFWVEGRLADTLNAGIEATDARRYDQILSVVGVPAVLAFVALLLFWPKEKPEPSA